MPGHGGARPRGKSQKKVIASTSESGKRSIKVSKSLTQNSIQQRENMHLKRQKPSTQRFILQRDGMNTQWREQGQEQEQSHKRGPRTVRRRRELVGHFVDQTSHDDLKESPGNFNEAEWAGEEIRSMQNEDRYDNDSTEESDSDDNVDTRYREQRWEPDYNVASQRSTWNRMEMSDEDADGLDYNGFVDDDNVEEDIDMNYGSVGHDMKEDVDMNDDATAENDDEESLETSGEDYSD